MSDPFEEISKKYNETNPEDPFAKIAEKYNDTSTTTNWDALFGGIAKTLYGAGRTAGIVSPEDYKAVFEGTQQAEKEHPIVSGLGQMAGVVGPAIAAGIAAPAVPFGAAILGSTAAGTMSGASSYARGGPTGENLDPTARLRTMDLDTSVGSLGYAAPVASGASLLPRLATGVAANVGIGAGNRAASNEILKDYPKLQQEVFDPTSAGLDAAFGLVAGGAHHLSSPKEVGTGDTVPNPADTPVNKTFKDHVEATVQQAQKDKQRAQEQIDTLEKRKTDPAYAQDSPERAQMMHDAINEQIKNHQNIIDNAETTIAKGQEHLDNIAGKVSTEPDTPTKSPIEESRTLIENKLDDLTALHQRLDDTIKNSQNMPTEAYQKKVTWLQNSIADLSAEIDQHYQEHNALQEGLKDAQDVSKDTIADAEFAREQDNVKIKSYSPREALNLGEMWDKALDESRATKTHEETPTSEHIDITAPEETGSWKDVQEATPEPRPAGLVISGGSKFIRDTVTDWVHRLGLGKENIDFNIGTHDHLLDENKSGSTEVNADNSVTINIKAKESFERALDANPKLKETVKKLSIEAAAQLKEVWVAAHELGHVLLGKLLQNDLFISGKEGVFNKGKGSLGLKKLLDDYDKWVKDSGGKEAIIPEGNLFYKPESKPDYYADFPEFFAQRSAFELVAGESSKGGPIAKFVNSIRSFMNDALKKLGLSLPDKKNVVDSFITDLISSNKKSLEETGKTIFEINSTSTSLHDAWMWQNKHLYPPKEGSGKGITGTVGMEDKPPTPADLQIKSAKEVVDEQLRRARDINPMGTGTAMKMVGDLIARYAPLFQGLQQKKNFYFDSPLIQHAADVIRTSINMQQARSMELLSGVTDFYSWKARGSFWLNMARVKHNDSPTIVFGKSSNLDFYETLQVHQHGIGESTYEAALEKYGQHLTEAQKTLFKSQYGMYRAMIKMAKDSAEALGKNSVISALRGWFPAVHKGSFIINWHIPGMERLAGMTDTGKGLMTDLVHSQRYFSEAEAKADLARWEALPASEKGSMVHYGVEEVGKTDLPNTMEEFFKAVQDQHDIVAQQGGDLAEMNDAIRRMKDQFIARGGQLGGHHQFRTNVTGALGSEMFATKEEAGKAFRQAHFDAVHEYTRQMMKMEVGEKIDLVTNHPDIAGKFPNTLDIVEQMKHHALNTSESFMEMKGLKRWLDTFYSDAIHPTASKLLPGLVKHPEAHIFDLAQGKVTSNFYHQTLMMRPAFILSQALQGMWTMRTLVSGGNGPIKALTNIARGKAQLVNPTEDFLQGLHYHTQEHQTFAPTFIHDLNQHGILELLKPGTKAKTILSIVSGEKPAAMADTFSRLTSYAVLYEHYRSLGYTGKELWDKAGEKTDDNMVQYGTQWKAPIFKKLGVLGDLMSPLQAFSTAALGNLAADFRYMLKDPDGVGHIKAAMPLMATTMITALMSGAIGVPLGAEYEGVAAAERALVDRLAGWTATAHMMNYISSELGMSLKMPSLIEVVLSGDNTFAHRVLSHGLISASTMPITDGEGLDIGSSLRFNPLFNGIMQGNKSWADLFPQFKFTFQELGYAKDILGNATGWTPADDATLRTASLGLSPGYLKGVTAMAKGYDLNPMELNSKGHALIPESPTTKLARFMGTTTIPMSVKRLRQQQSYQKEMQDTADIKNIQQRLTDAVQKGDKTTIRILATKLATKYGISSSAISNQVGNELDRRTRPEAERKYVGRSGNSSPAQQLQFKNDMELYNDNPYLKPEDSN